jgi:hypothetical protein
MSLYRKVSVALINSSLPEPYNSYGDHWKDGFEDAGCDVTLFPYNQIQFIPPKFDLYFFVEIRYKLSDIPWYLNPRVLYSWDSHLTGPEYFEGPSHNFDKILLASKIDVETLISKGILNVAWIPEACNPRVHKNLHVNRLERLGFIGNSNNSILRNGKTKDDFINHLKEGPYKLYQKTHVWGNDYNVEQNRIQVMFDRTISYNIGTRIFESCAAGCLPVWSKTNYDTGISTLLTEGEHYVPYNDTVEDIDKVLGGLYEDPDRMKRITDAAEKHVLNNHTYSHRVMQILDLFEIKTIQV